jgi:hypothetical protein
MQELYKELGTTATMTALIDCRAYDLIEWKYTESYGQPIDADGNATRLARYSNKAFAPDGPIRTDLDLKLEDFFWEPFYQLLRQQMLAWRMAKVHEADAHRVRVLHISPVGNHALHKVTAPSLRRFGDEAFQVFRSVLVQPGDFLSRTTGEIFTPFIKADHGGPASREWAKYLLDRYGSILG